MADTKDENKLTTSADKLRAPNDPTEDPYHTRGIDPAAAEAGFRLAGYPEKGPLAGRKPGDNLSIEDAGNLGPIAVVDADEQVNPTADAYPPLGGVISSDALVSDQSTAKHPAPKDTRKPAKPTTTTTVTKTTT